MAKKKVKGQRCMECEKAVTTALQLKLQNMKMEKELERLRTELKFYKNKDAENQSTMASLR